MQHFGLLNSSSVLFERLWGSVDVIMDFILGTKFALGFEGDCVGCRINILPTLKLFVYLLLF